MISRICAECERQFVPKREHPEPPLCGTCRERLAKRGRVVPLKGANETKERQRRERLEKVRGAQ